VTWAPWSRHSLVESVDPEFYEFYHLLTLGSSPSKMCRGFNEEHLAGAPGTPSLKFWTQQSHLGSRRGGAKWRGAKLQIASGWSRPRRGVFMAASCAIGGLFGIVEAENYIGRVA
jgi:hypothetical protein